MEWESLFENSSMDLIGATGTWLMVLIIWSLIWKGLALWRAARRTDKAWFIIFLFVNTVGILEIIYYFLIAKSDKKA